MSFKISVSSSSEHLTLCPETHHSHTFWYFVPIPMVYLNPANWSQMDVTNGALNLPYSHE